MTQKCLNTNWLKIKLHYLHRLHRDTFTYISILIEINTLLNDCFYLIFFGIFRLVKIVKCMFDFDRTSYLSSEYKYKYLSQQFLSLDFVSTTSKEKP